MTKKKTAKKRTARAPRVNMALLGRRLTWTDLGAWAGDRSLKRGRTYAEDGHVRDLSRLEDGHLVAWVRGTAPRQYATQVSFVSAGRRSGRLLSTCTCPVGWNGCNHAVALVVDWLKALKTAREIPRIRAARP